ncbi:MAG TPA: pitrilysin family protein [Pseudobacteroides sp.]|uniref:EF-P 5-aminopentanol modification-associated protein YfmF n=1 Tax=Pseudobacteroides sp. TaxID=1968840 RepID=UPI002F95071B
MDYKSSEEKVDIIDSFNGIEVYKVMVDKFKTNSINIFFQDNLSKENATKNALVPAVLRRGTKKHKTFKDIALYLEELYGASFDCAVNKKGEYQLIQFYIDHVSDKYTGSDTNLFEDCTNLLLEVITEPLVENGAFKKDYLEQEKENLKKIIEGRMNDKVQYAVERCFEEMCKGEPFEIYENGSIEDLNKIQEADLFNHYKYILESLPMKVFISGDVDDSKIQSAIAKLKNLKRGNIKGLSQPIINKPKKDTNFVTEKLDVSQGKLSIGFRTNTASHDKDYYSLVVCNSILGGGIHSKLFQNVREKESLAYYAFSRLEKFKGLMMISCGIEVSNKDKAYNLILKQLEEIRQGNISDYEYDSSIKSIKTGLESLKDSQLAIVDFYLSQKISNTSDTLKSLYEKFEAVTRDEIVKASQKVEIDTVYFLSSENQ